MKQTILAVLIILSLITISRAEEKDKSDCYPITSADFIRPDAPKFSQYPAKPEKNIHPAPLNLKSNPFAKLFRTALRQGLSEGPNFAGHFTVVGIRGGIGAMSIAVVDFKTGNVVTPDSFKYVSDDVLNADNFEPNTNSGYLVIRFRLDSRLLIVLGSLDGNHQREGAFYFRRLSA